MALKSKENDLKRWVTPKKRINFKAAKQFARSRMVPLLPLIMVVTRNCFEAITGKEKNPRFLIRKFCSIYFLSICKIGELL